MTTVLKSPWASGPGEILKHGLELLKKDTDTHRRLAIISVDNAVELMIKTYLGLPERVTGLKISRSKYQEISESFPKLLDTLEEYANDKLDGIDLGEIEWYHRLRNQLYHQGNGLTVERDKVEVYAELANVLFSNLFGFRLIQSEKDETLLLGEYMQAWMNFEQAFSEAFKRLEIDRRGEGVPMFHAEYMVATIFLPEVEATEINQLREIRDLVIRGTKNHKDVIKPEMVERIIWLANELKKGLQSGKHELYKRK